MGDFLTASHSSSHSSPFKDWYNRVMGHGKSAMTSARHHASQLKGHAEQGVHVVRAGGEGIVTGAGLALIHANAPNGLDLQVKKPGPDGKGGITLPLDLMASLGGFAASVGTAGSESSHDAKNIGTAAMGVFSFRKTLDLLAEKRATTGAKIKGTVGQPKAGAHGEFGEDPILAAARA